ncbi:MAG TPA: hypothetical protein VEL31_17550, partial [Ktedonobacteraceae bacterium]|nr:hypothetical protein [Ktedonobacteraceae bacterium]
MPTQLEQEISTELPVPQTGFPQGDAPTTEQVYISQASKQTRRQRPSPLVWRFTVVAGDSIVLAGSLAAALALLAPSYAGFNVSNSPFGLLHAPIMWLFLVIASWSIAVSIIQAQELQCI